MNEAMEQKVMEDLAMARRLTFVPRWSVVPLLRQQNVAEHSYNVAMLVNAMIPFCVNSEITDDPHSLIMHALTHDIDESITGDMPSPTKKENPECSIAGHFVKIADILEAIIFLNEDRRLGNRSVDNIVASLVERLEPHMDVIEWHNNSPWLERPEYEVFDFVRHFCTHCSPQNHPIMWDM